MTHEEAARRIIESEHLCCRGEIKKVWECKTLQHWKGLFAVLSADPVLMWEITWDGDSDSYYSNRYAKASNQTYKKDWFKEEDKRYDVISKSLFLWKQCM